MKKLSVLLCGIGISIMLTGCGEMIELTQDESDIITEYAVELLLKYDKYHNDRLVDLADYEEEQVEPEQEEPVIMPEEENVPEEDNIVSGSNAEVVDVSEQQASTIEEFYGIEGVAFQYTGYELKSEYPDMSQESTELYFALPASPGTQLLVLKFQANNISGSDIDLDMTNYGIKTRISVNDEESKSALTTMLLNDLQKYRGVLGAGASTELVAIIEVPEGTYVETISLTLRSDSDSVKLSLQ
ncbi:MAG: hypothetical protein NC433_14875 [Clostridiales bacterium]|nr:hypothetical protein [Clostridiales bacterium]